MILRGGSLVTAATVANDRTGSRLSIFDGNGTIAEDAADTANISPGATAFGCMAGATTIVSTDLSSGWSSGGAGVAAVTEPETGIYRIAFNGGGPVVLTASLASASENRWAGCQARLISGSFVGGATNDYLGFRSGGTTLIGTQFPLANITSEWNDIACSVTAAAGSSNQLVFRSNNASPAVIEVRYMRCAAAKADVPGFAYQAAASASYASDNLAVSSLSWPTSGTVLAVCDPYFGWSAATHPVSTTAELWLSTGDGYDLRLNGSGYPQARIGSTLTSTKLLSTGRSVLAVDWNGVEIGLRHDDEDRISTAETAAPSGDFVLGSDASGALNINAAMAYLIFDYVLSDYEYDILRQAFIADVASWQ